MKKTAFFLIFLLFLPFASDGEANVLKLRSSKHEGFLRIVLEGQESLLNKGLVNQRGKDVVVAFHGTVFSIQSDGIVLSYQKPAPDTVLFSPGSFRGLKVFKLKHPARLVIDVFMEGAAPLPRSGKQSKASGVKRLNRIETIIIDPGHGGYESGIVQDGNKEKNTVLDIAKKLGLLINRSTSKSYLTRGSDRFMSLSDRIRFSKEKNADVFLSIHIGHHSGIVIYVPVITDTAPEMVKPYLDNKGQAGYLEDTLILLKAVQEAALSDFGSDMVTVKPIPYSIMSGIEAAALMIEFPSFDDAYYVEELNAEMANTLYKGLYIYEEIKAN